MYELWLSYVFGEWIKISFKKNGNEKNFYTFYTENLKFRCKKKWIIGSLSSSAVISVDAGAAKALLNGKSLLAAGIIKVKGSFDKGENVLIVDQNEKQLARGLARLILKKLIKLKANKVKKLKKF